MIVFTSNGGPLIVDIPGGWATVLVALISFVLGPYLLQARANRRIKKIDEKTDRTLDQVENNHRDPVTGEPINMREENDDRHEAVMTAIENVKRTQVDHGSQLRDVQSTQRGMQRDIGRLADQDVDQQRRTDKLSDHVHELEQTIPKHRLGEDHE